MKITHGRVGLIAACAALIGAAACNRDQSTVSDDSLVRDLAAAGAGGASGLELAPSAARPQVVVSPIEAGQTSAPKRATPKRAPSPAPHATPSVAKQQRPAPAPTPGPSPVVAETPTPPPAAEPARAPITRPVPAPTPAQQNRVYKTEAEIFRDMPWIRP